LADDLLPHEQALYEPAKKEGDLTWYSGQLQAETGEAVGEAFTQRYPGIRLSGVPAPVAGHAGRRGAVRHEALASKIFAASSVGDGDPAPGDGGSRANPGSGAVGHHRAHRHAAAEAAADGGWLIVFIEATRELSAAIFLVGPKTRTMAVLLHDLSEAENFEVLAALDGILLVITMALVGVGMKLLGRDFMLRRA
jgi:hypothetical protein